VVTSTPADLQCEIDKERAISGDVRSALVDAPMKPLSMLEGVIVRMPEAQSRPVSWTAAENHRDWGVGCQINEETTWCDVALRSWPSFLRDARS